MRRRFFFITFALTTLIVAVPAWFLRPPQHSLMNKAVQIPGIHLGYGRDEYQWLSPDELLVFRPAGALGWTVYNRNILTGTVMPMPALTRLLRLTSGNPYSVKIAPDHNRLLWAGAGKRIYEATLTGTEFQQWAYGPDEGGYSYWLGDSRRFVRYSQSRFGDSFPAILRDTAAPRRVQRLSHHWSEGDMTRAQLAFLVTAQRSPTRIYAEAGSNDREQRDAYIEVSIIGPAEVREEFAKVPLPPGFFFDLRSNPYRLSDGQTMIWTLGSSDMSQPTNTVGLYVSRADGLGWRFVGDWQEPAQLDDHEQQGEKAPGNFRWVPGDEHISFEYAGGLYLVPAG